MALQTRDLDAAALGRVRSASLQIQNTRRMVAAGVPLAAEPRPERLKAVLKARAGMSSTLAETVMSSIVAAGQAARATPEAGAAAAPAPPNEFSARWTLSAWPFWSAERGHPAGLRASPFATDVHSAPDS